MARLLFGLGVAAVIFTIYAVADCAFFDRMRIRGLRRGWWIVIILFVPIIGGLLWFIVGRGRAGRVGSSRGGTVAPDDDVEFLRQLRSDAEQDERIRRMEQELAELDADEPRNPTTPGTAVAAPRAPPAPPAPRTARAARHPATGSTPATRSAPSASAPMRPTRPVRQVPPADRMADPAPLGRPPVGAPRAMPRWRC